MRLSPRSPNKCLLFVSQISYANYFINFLPNNSFPNIIIDFNGKLISVIRIELVFLEISVSDLCLLRHSLCAKVIS